MWESAKLGKTRYLVKYDVNGKAAHKEGLIGHTPDTLNYFLSTMIHIPYTEERYDVRDWSEVVPTKIHRCSEHDGSEPRGRGGVPSHNKVYGTTCLPSFKQGVFGSSFDSIETGGSRVAIDDSMFVNRMNGGQRGTRLREMKEGFNVPEMGEINVSAIVSDDCSDQFKALCKGIGEEIAASLGTTLYRGMTFANALGFRHQLNSRNCPFKGGNHKSNHIRIVVQLLPVPRGAVIDISDSHRPKPVWYIVCSDLSDCGGKKTEPQAIPNYETRWKASVDRYLTAWDESQTIGDELFSFLDTPESRVDMLGSA